MSVAPRPPAGWYDDPERAGGRRYWDGNAWTEHRADPEQAAPPPRKSTGRWWIWAVVAAVILFAFAGIAGITSESGGRSGDASARVACREWVSVFRDFRDGVLTDAEFRERVQEVADRASVSDVPGLPEASRSMLAAATRRDAQAFHDHAEEFARICRTVDF